MVRTIIYWLILIPLCATLLWMLMTSKTPAGRIAFALVIIALVICIVTVVKDKRQ